MNTPQNGKKRTPTENRYNFNQPRFEDAPQDWLISDTYSDASLSEQNDQLGHQPAPMQKRNRKPPVDRWSTFTIVTLIGLVSFTFVVDLAGGGKMRHILMAKLTPAPSVESITLPAPAPQAVVKAPEPVVPIVPPAPPVVKVEPEPALAVPSTKPEPLVKAAPVIAQILQGQVVRDCADCPELIAVSAGGFVFKTASNSNERVRIDHNFAIGRNAITFDDWGKCVGAGACSPITEDAGWGRANRPLIFVSFEELTNHYLPWLSKLTGLDYRLPSKDEWQYAALGGESGAAKSTNQIRLASQDCFNASGPHAEGCSDTFDGTSPVGSFAPNTLGLNDMKGNVWSWSADCWQPFTNAPSLKSNACAMRVLLGGAWSTNRNVVTVDFSGWEKPTKKANSIGFRVVRNLP